MGDQKDFKPIKPERMPKMVSYAMALALLLAGCQASSNKQGRVETQPTPIPMVLPTSPVTKAEIEKEKNLLLNNPTIFNSDQISVRSDSMYSNFVEMIGGKRVTYSEKVHDTITLLFFNNSVENGRTPVAGEILPLKYTLPSDSLEEISLVPFVFSGTGQNLSEDLVIDNNKQYSVMPVVTTGDSTRGIIPIRGSNGPIVGSSYEDFSVIGESTAQQSTGYFSWALFEEGEDEMEFLGIVSRSAPDIYIDDAQGVPMLVTSTMNQ